jgi:hypothetical protein
VLCVCADPVKRKVLLLMVKKLMVAGKDAQTRRKTPFERSSVTVVVIVVHSC